MELDAVVRAVRGAQSLNAAVRRARVDDQFGRQGAFVDHERVVARCAQAWSQPAKQATPGMLNAVSSAMDWLRAAHHVGSAGQAKHLVP